MKVLVANKYYFVKGGAERYLFELGRILEERGVATVPFAMEHEENEPSEHSDLFVSHESFDGAGGPLDGVRAAARLLYSVEAKKKIEALVDRTRPDVGHLHNIAHQLSPSIIVGLRAKGVPVVQTLHDYKLVCPNYQMFLDGKTCERCGHWRYYRACVHRCMRGSLAPSALVCLEAYLHKMMGTYVRNVDLFIAPSQQLLERMVAHGIDRKQIVHLPYSIALDEYEPTYVSNGYAVYVGRLSTGKGLETLMRALAQARGIPFKVVGDGPLADELARVAAEQDLADVEFVGYLNGNELKSIVAGSTCVVVPSECYENSPLTVYEACAMGKPVVGSSIGGIPELVVDGETGLLFPPGDDGALAARLEELWGDRARAVDMGKAARARVEREYGPDRHFEQIMAIYERVTH
jgi:glycosyltransferase involved in cell wall biosynthesis